MMAVMELAFVVVAFAKVVLTLASEELSPTTDCDTEPTLLLRFPKLALMPVTEMLTPPKLALMPPTLLLTLPKLELMPPTLWLTSPSVETVPDS